MPRITRRTLMAGGLGIAGLSLTSRLALGGAPEVFQLVAQETRFTIGATPTAGVFTYGTGAPPVLRLRQGQPARIEVTNRLPDDVTTVHWHGLRNPFAMDGVPFLTQYPIGPGETFAYEFTPADAGTFWYHPHCNTLDQISRGLAGIIVVQEATDQGFDADLPLMLRDFRLGGDDQFIPFFKPRNAARGGSLGTVQTVNWAVAPALAAPAGGLVRLRLAVTDVTRVYDLRLQGAEARLIALDGHPLPMPGALTEGLRLAPGQRADLALVMPAGAEVSLLNRLADGTDHVLATLHPEGSDLGRSAADLRPLPPNPLPLPDLANAETLDFVFGWSPDGKAPDSGGICGDVPFRFWSINRVAGNVDTPAEGANGLAPLAELRRGASYRLRLLNETQNDHPIHLHGLAMHLIGPDGRLTGEVRDTVLLRSHDSAEVAVMADNPGTWVFHCHVIEHQKTGLAGLIKVA